MGRLARPPFRNVQICVSMCVRVCACAYVHVRKHAAREHVHCFCVRACVRALRACVRACVCVRALRACRACVRLRACVLVRACLSSDPEFARLFVLLHSSCCCSMCLLGLVRTSVNPLSMTGVVDSGAQREGWLRIPARCTSPPACSHPGGRPHK